MIAQSNHRQSVKDVWERNNHDNGKRGVTSADVEERDSAAIIRKVFLHIIPLLGVLYLIAYIDRQNVGFAKLQMKDSLGISEASYGLGASLFFAGYFLFEIPSNLFLARIGARIWLSRIIFTWGLVTIALAFTPNAHAFYLLRFALGVAEAGFFPGVLYTLMLWLPQQYRARAVGILMMFSAAANVLGPPINGMLLGLSGVLGLAGWQWIFLVTGMPALLAGALTPVLLPREPSEARFLNEHQRKWLKVQLDAEKKSHPSAEVRPLKVLCDKRTILLALYAIPFPLAAYGLTYWMPTVISGFGVSNGTNGLLNSIPWALAAVGMFLIPWSSARRHEQVWHMLLPTLAGGVCLAASAVAHGPALQFSFLCIGTAMVTAAQPIFWSLTQGYLTGRGAAAALAAINSVANLGGFIAQAILPAIAQRSGQPFAPMLVISVALATTAGLTFPLHRLMRKSSK